MVVDVRAEPPPAPARRRRFRPRPGRAMVWIGRIAVPVGLVLLWHFGVSSGFLPEISFSTPADVADQLAAWFSTEEILNHAGITLVEAATGFVAGAGLAILVVISFTLLPVLAEALTPVLVVLNAVPRMALAPLFIAWFGLGLFPKVVLVATVVFFIVFFNLYHGLTALDAVVLANLRVLGAGRYQMVVQFYLPALLSWLFSSLRTSVGFAFASAVVAEYLGSTKGLGYLIFYGLARYRPQEAIAGMIVMLVLVLMIDALLRLVEARFSVRSLGHGST